MTVDINTSALIVPSRQLLQLL